MKWFTESYILSLMKNGYALYDAKDKLDEFTNHCKNIYNETVKKYGDVCFGKTYFTPYQLEETMKEYFNKNKTDMPERHRYANLLKYMYEDKKAIRQAGNFWVDDR